MGGGRHLLFMPSFQACVSCSIGAFQCLCLPIKNVKKYTCSADMLQIKPSNITL